jgi:UDP-GlcNAc:undecaprenyl-phosphate GlcNAc-1-phosphate transferase
MGIFLSASLFSFLATLISIPFLIYFSKKNNLLDSPDALRKLHESPTPTLGGVGIFIGLFFSVIIYSSFFSTSQVIPLIILCCLLILCLGIYDDLFHLPPLNKLFGQIFVALVLFLFVDIRIEKMYGIFGVDTLSYGISLLLTIFTIVVSINAYNLIDGIDGLAAILGLVSLFFLAYFFWIDMQFVFCVLSFSIAGSLIAFLVFNVSPAKIFMGDGGSMLLGLILSILAIQFISSAPVSRNFYVKESPAVGFGIVALPLLDTLRIFILRISRGVSPLYPDRNHIHHMLQDIGFSHTKIALVLGSFSIFLIFCSWIFSLLWNATFSFIILVFVYFFMVFILKNLKKKF